MNTQLLSHYRNISRGGSIVVLAIGLLVLIGWLFDLPTLKSIVPGLATMKANSAIAFVLAGVALWHVTREQKGGRVDRLVRICAAIIMLIGLVTLAEYIFGRDFGIDQLLFKEEITPQNIYPGRMSPVTALNFSLLGFALLLLSGAEYHRLIQSVTITALLTSILALIGHAYSIPSLYQLFPYSTVAIHTALAFSILCLGILFARPDAGLMRIFSSDDPGGVMARRLMPAALMLPILLGWLLLTGERMGFYDNLYRLVLFATSSVIIFAILILWNARMLDRMEVERGRVEKALSLSEQRAQALIENSWDAIALFGADGTILYGSPSTPQILGYSLSEFVGRNAFELIHQEDQALVTERIKLSLQRTREHISVYARVRHKNGEWRWLEGVFTNLLDEPSVQAIVNNYHDFTERKQDEDALRESEAHKSAILASALDCIITIDHQGRILEFNPAAQATFGYRPEEVLGKKMVELIIPPSLREQHRLGFERYLATRKGSILGRRLELTGMRSDGTEFPVELTISRITDIDPPIFTGFLRDITERKQADQTLRENEERFRLIVQAASSSMIVVDRNGKIDMVNERAQALFGYRREELLRRPVEMLVPERFRVGHPGHRQNFLAQPASRPMGAGRDLFGLHKDGHEIPIEIELTPYESSDGLLTLALVVDITERKRIQDALRESETRYRSMFESAAVSIWAEDFTEVQVALDDLKRRGIEDFREYFSKHPEFLVNAVAAVKVLDVNEQSLRLFGAASKDELLGSLNQIFLPETLAVFAEELAVLAEGHKYYEGEATVQTLQGERREVLVSIHFPATGDDHTLVSLVDITERKRAEAMLRESEGYAYSLLRLSKRLEQAQTYSEALDAALDQVKAVLGYQNVWTYLLSEDKQSLRLLTTTGELSQMIAEDFPTLPIKGDRFLEEIVAAKDIVLVEDARTDPRTNKDIVAQLGNRTIVNVPIVLMDRHLGAFGTGSFGEEGVHVPTSTQLEYLRSLASHMAVTLDRIHLLTERKQAEQQIAYQAYLLENVNDAVIGSDENSLIRFWNQGAERIFGWKAEEVLGRSGREILRSEFINTDRETVLKILAEQGRWRGEAILYRKDGSQVIMEVSSITLRDASGLINGYVSVNRDITERKHAEAQNRFLANLVASVSDAIIAVDLQQNIQSWNTGAEAMYGWKEDEVLGRSAKEILDTDFLQTKREAVTKQIMEQGYWAGEVSQLRRDGARVPTLSSVALYKDSEGKPAGIVAVNRDITDRKQYEEELRKNTVRAQTLAEVSGALAAVHLDYATVLDTIARRTTELIGDACSIRLVSDDGQWLEVASLYHPEPKTLAGLREILGTNPLRTDTGSIAQIIQTGRPMLIPAISPEQLKTIVPSTARSILEHISIHSLLTVPLRAQGRVLGTLTLTRDQPGHPYTSDDQAFLQDLADRAALSIVNARLYTSMQELNAELEQRVVQRTAQLQESEEKFSKAFLASPAAVSIASLPDGRYINVNDALVKLTGYSKEELLGHTSAELGLVDSSAHEKILAVIRDKGFAHNVEIQIHTKSNQIAEVLTSMEQFELSGRPCMLSVNYDITERKRAEVALQKAKLELESTNKELEAFSYSVSHDLRSPLRSIDGFSQALLEDYEELLPAEGRAYLDRIRKSAQRMAQLIDDLLGLSRITRTPLQARFVNISALAQGVANDLKQAQQERQVTFLIATELAAQGDPQLIRIVLENLMGNAWKFTSKRTDAYIEIGVQNHAEQQAFFVRDNGAGFDMTYADKLFGAFQRLHAITEFPGSGIGLATVQRIIHRHGGRVWAEAAVGQGATFFFTLPELKRAEIKAMSMEEDSINIRAKEII